MAPRVLNHVSIWRGIPVPKKMIRLLLCTSKILGHFLCIRTHSPLSCKLLLKSKIFLCFYLHTHKPPKLQKSLSLCFTLLWFVNLIFPFSLLFFNSPWMAKEMTLELNLLRCCKRSRRSWYTCGVTFPELCRRGRRSWRRSPLGFRRLVTPGRMSVVVVVVSPWLSLVLYLLFFSYVSDFDLLAWKPEDICFVLLSSKSARKWVDLDKNLRRRDGRNRFSCISASVLFPEGMW